MCDSRAGKPLQPFLDTNDALRFHDGEVYGDRACISPQSFDSNDGYSVCIIISRLRTVFGFDLMFTGRVNSEPESRPMRNVHICSQSHCSERYA
jgi:hypothetical protein